MPDCHGGRLLTVRIPQIAGAQVEAAMTAALVFCIFCFTDPEKGVPADAAPALIGLTVGSLVHVFVRYSRPPP